MGTKKEDINYAEEIGKALARADAKKQQRTKVIKDIILLVGLTLVFIGIFKINNILGFILLGGYIISIGHFVGKKENKM